MIFPIRNIRSFWAKLWISWSIHRMTRLLNEMNAPRLRPVWVGHVGLWPTRRFKLGWRKMEKRAKEWSPRSTRKAPYPFPIYVVSFGWVTATIGR